MINIFIGIPTILGCLAGFILAYKQFQKNRFKYSLGLIILCGLILRLFVASDCRLHSWDERYHAVVAKHLMDSPLYPTLYDDPVLSYNYKDWTRNHVWLHKQPFPLWMMAFSMTFFGINELALRLPSILISTIGIGITFSIGRYFYSNKVGLIAAFLYAINGLILELTAGRTTAGHIDIFFLFFIELGVFFAIKYFQNQKILFNILCGVSVGVAILSKWLPALIVLPLWLLLAFHTKKLSLRKTAIQFFALCAVISAIALPWQVYIAYEFPKVAAFEQAYNFKHLTEVVEGHDGPFYYHFDKARRLFGQLIYLPLIWFLYKTFKKVYNIKRLFIAVWIIVPFLFFSVAQTKMQAYTMFTAPAVFIMIGLFLQYLNIYKDRFKYKKGILLIMFLLIAFPVRYAIERTKPYLSLDRNPEWTKEIRALGSQLDYEDQTVIINAKRPIETMFYTNCTAYKKVPKASKMAKIKEDGYRILIRKRKPEKHKLSKPHNEGVLLKNFNVIYVEWKPDTTSQAVSG
jgi:4-amino-4-deoxy-L-arabinose transferase-like glycosyltransferase